MKTVELEASLREKMGKSEAKRTRDNGRIPAIIYGGEKELSVSVDYKVMEKIVFNPDRHFITIDLDGKKYSTIIQELQFHPVTDKLTHIDFLEFSGNEPIVMNIPVRTKGVSPGVQAGGNLFSKMRNVLIKALPKDMPEVVEIDISELNINMAVHIKDLATENIEFLASPNATVIAIVAARDTLLDEEEGEGEEDEEGEGEGEEGASEGAEGEGDSDKKE